MWSGRQVLPAARRAKPRFVFATVLGSRDEELIVHCKDTEIGHGGVVQYCVNVTLARVKRSFFDDCLRTQMRYSGQGYRLPT